LATSHCLLQLASLPTDRGECWDEEWLRHTNPGLGYSHTRPALWTLSIGVSPAGHQHSKPWGSPHFQAGAPPQSINKANLGESPPPSLRRYIQPAGTPSLPHALLYLGQPLHCPRLVAALSYAHTGQPTLTGCDEGRQRRDGLLCGGAHGLYLLFTHALLACLS